jgi:hypothetical protein
MGITWKGCAPGNFRRGRAGFTPDAIVVHIMDGSLVGTDAWFNDPDARVCAHYGVGKTGEVHQYVQETDTAFHAGIVDRPTWTGLRPGVNPNLHTLGVEHEGRANTPWTPAMYNASSALICAAATRWSIPLDRAHVIGHREIRASKSCPGSQVDLDRLIAQAAGATPPPLPSPHAGRDVTLRVNANLRREAPSVSAPVVRVLPAGSLVHAVGFSATGDAVRGNPFWYRDVEGNWIWAGATDQPLPG